MRFAFILFLVSLFFLSGCAIDSDIDFSQRVLKGLVKDKLSVEDLIDWQVFQAFAEDIGARYSSLPTEKAKSYYRQGFIHNFALGFHSAGGRLEDFRHWRIYAKDKQRVVVAVDNQMSKRTCLLTISKQARKKLVAMEWKE